MPDWIPKKTVVNKAHAPHLPKSIRPDPKWTAQAVEDAKQDFKSIPYDGITPNKMVCDTTLRELPDGSWILFILAGGDTEPSPLNYTGVTRSTDQGKTWTPLAPFDVGFPPEGKTIGQGPTELMITGQRSTLFFSTHSKHWANDWRSWYLTSDDSFKTGSKPMEVSGRLKERTFIRKHIVCKDGRIMIPFQHYIGPDDEKDKAPLDRSFTNPRNGVLISSDAGGNRGQLNGLKWMSFVVSRCSNFGRKNRSDDQRAAHAEYSEEAQYVVLKMNKWA